MLPELRNDKEAQVTLMLLLAEKNEFNKTATVKEFMVTTGLTSSSRAYLIYKKAQELADIRKELAPLSVRFLYQMDRAMTKAVKEYETTGKNCKDVVEIAGLWKEILGLQNKIEGNIDKTANNPIIQNNVTLDSRSLEAVAKELAKETINVKPEGFGINTTGPLPGEF